MNAPADSHEGRRSAVLRFLAEPLDINFGGKVHGGSVMKWIDQAAYTCAVGWSRCYAVTVSLSGLRFYRPIHVGELVELEARIIHTGHSSMHIHVSVRAGDPSTDQLRRTAECVVVFVALDDQQRPTEVPGWQPTRARDRALQQYAIDLRATSQHLEAQLGSISGQDAPSRDPEHGTG